MKRKMGKFIRVICLILFVVGLVRKMQNGNFLNGFLRKKSRLVGIRWFLFFSVIVLKSQISF